MIIKDDHLYYILVQKEDLKDEETHRMYELMISNYSEITPEIFQKDLDQKQLIGLIKDVSDRIQGFTTYAVDPAGTDGSNHHIIFSGDTIIDPKHWGTQILMKGWCHTIGRIIASDNNKNWYWYLLSKGHRTFMYLPLFFKQYYPSPLPADNHDCLAEIADITSTKLYGDSWKKDLGIIRFDHYHSALNVELAEATFKKTNSPFVRFFLERNPEFHKGDELVCIAHLHPDNLIRTAREYILKGMEHPLEFGS